MAFSFENMLRDGHETPEEEAVERMRYGMP